MFKKFALIEDKSERLEIYNLIRFNLKVCVRVFEFFYMAVLVSGLAWLISEPLTARLGLWGGAPVAIGLMLIMAAIIRFPLLYLLVALNADFGLDPRPPADRIKALLKRVGRRYLACWLLSLAAFWALTVFNLWVWSLLVFMVGAGLVLLNAFWPRLLTPGTLRPLLAEELSPWLLERLDLWKEKNATKLGSGDLMVAVAFSDNLEPPRLEGLGSTLRLVIPQKAIVHFTPREMALWVVSAAMAGLIKAPVKVLFLRLCSLAVAVPLASIFISAFGSGLLAYPLVFSPALIALVWPAFWIGHWLAELTILMTWRSINVQLAAAASILLKDEEAIEATLSTLADKNLEEENPPAWRELFLTRPSKKAFLKGCKYHQHMAKFSG